MGITMSLASLGVAACALALGYLYQRYCRRGPFLPGLPFPAELHKPILGAAMEIATLEGMNRLFRDAADPNGMVSFYLMSQPTVAVTRADHVRLAYCASNYRPPDAIVDNHLHRLLGPRALPLLMRDEWKLHRRLVSRAFQWQNLAAMVPAMASIAETFTDVWLHAKTPSIDIYPLLTRSAVDTISVTGFGYDMGALRDASSQVASALAFLLSEMSRRCFNDPLYPSSHIYWLPTRMNRRHAEASAVVRSTLRAVIQARIEAPPTSARSHDLLQAMLDAASDDNSPMDADTLADNVLTFFFAGSDTTSSAMAYALFLLATHPEVQAKAVAEIDSVVGKTAPITYEAIQQLPYVSAVLTETLRLFPSVPITTRSLESPLVLGEWTLPVGVLMLIPTWFVNRSPLNWGNDAELFKPERHVDETHNLSTVSSFSAKDRAFRFVSFSGGPRNCVGMRFAQLEAMVMLVTVLRRCAVSRPSDVPCVIPKTMGIALAPNDGMWLSVAPRAMDSA